MHLQVILILLLAWHSSSRDITNQVFGNAKDILPAAFGDFNSDEITDLFILTNGGKTVEILLGSLDSEPLLKASNLSCSFKKCSIRSVVPGDFNGDAFMDVLVVTECSRKSPNLDIHILWGGQVYLNCSFNEDKPLLTTVGEPLALDCNNDFIIDLFGVKAGESRGFWIFSKHSEPKFSPVNVTLKSNINLSDIREPHANAFLDLNNDNVADLFVTSQNGHSYQFEVWRSMDHNCRFSFEELIWPPKDTDGKLGQSVFLDLELRGKLDHIVPYLDKKNPKIYVYSEKKWHDVNVSFKDQQGQFWHFFDSEELPFSKAVTLRGGDYNMDGYPDLLSTLTNGKISRTFLLENSPCTACGNFSRTFKIQWDSFSNNINDSVLGVFYDILQDGVVDVLIVTRTRDKVYHAKAFKNNLDYDANFVKVMVLTGLTNKNATAIEGPLRKKKQTFGTNLPGPRISYKTVDQEGKIRIGVSAQIPQSAHYSLYLPYIMFALGRTPNFLENITVGFASRYREWPQIIPNSQMVVIPHPIDNPARWTVQLFVTPSKVVYTCLAVLIGTCFFIFGIIVLLHLHEKKMDRLERRQEAYRFHFDAM